MDALIYAIISFLLHALALYLSVEIVAEGASERENTYFKAIGVSLVLGALAWLFLDWLVLAVCGGWLVYLVLWFAVIMGVYRLSFLKSLGVAILQVGIRVLIGLTLKFFGLVIPSLKMIEI
jgi:hypothetical protein